MNVRNNCYLAAIWDTGHSGRPLRESVGALFAPHQAGSESYRRPVDRPLGIIHCSRHHFGDSHLGEQHFRVALPIIGEILDPEFAKSNIEGLLNAARAINTLVWSGVVLSAAVILLKVSKQPRFKFLNVELDLKYFPIAALLFTCVHAYLASIFRVAVDKVQALGVKESVLALERVRDSGGFLFMGFQPRRPALGPFGPTYVAQMDDRAFWLTVVLAAVLATAVVASVIPPLALLRQPAGRGAGLNAIAFGSLAAGLNWLVGSAWAIALSSLSPS